MKIKRTTDTDSKIYRDGLDIRMEVFVKEQGVPEASEIDAQEEECLYLVGYEGNIPVACGRLWFAKEEEGVLQRVAVRKAYRKRGYGQAMIEHLLQAAKEQGHITVRLHAQLPAIPLYERLGFKTQGPVFEEAGLAHQLMVQSF